MKTKVITLSFFILLTSNVFAQTNDEIISAFKKSYSYEKDEEYKNAVNILKNVYSDDSYEINLRLGWLEYNAGNFDESVKYYQKAISLKPYSEEAKLGLIYPKNAQGKFTEIKEICNKILEINPNNTTANYKLGLFYFYKKDYNTALRYFEKVLNLYPFDYNSLLMTAWTKYYLGNKSEAKILFSKVLMNNPDDKSATEGLKLTN